MAGAAQAVPALSRNHRKISAARPRARGIFMVPPYRRMHFQQEWNDLCLTQ
jgi:hypothetical protein